MGGQADHIQKQFDLLQEARTNLWKKIVPLTDQQWMQQPTPYAWSVAQTANHLYLSEQLSMAYLKKKLSFPDSVPSYHPKSWMGVWLIKLVLFTSWKRKAPKHIDMWQDQPILHREELDEKWSALRKDMITYIMAQEPQFGRHLAYRHPFAGRMTMRQMLIFFGDHFKHHSKQVDRVMRQIGAHP